ncbi:molybdenum cofactor guanylyltransferase [Cohnella panacarvi]|uniref:molybdenum cofactor guanylyltransferase n=1 Tax=Cohnella panacarvi TaxID=400776 RepID=UPI00047EE39E|nr:molybdenum cofactor guanylyltransferase [Cohnella panacarvi]
MTIAAVILAGGQGRRMGYVNKAHLALDGERFIDRQLRLAGEWAEERIVVVNDASRAAELSVPADVRVILDRYAGEGPLAGLHAGLQETTKPFAWVIGCDQPLIDANAARLLLERMRDGGHQAALPIIDGRPQPLHALYRAETSEIAGRLLASGERKLLSLLDRIDWIGLESSDFGAQGISARFADDIDTPEQYGRLRS